MKKHLTRQEEFDILKLVLDKFLLLGIFLLGYGLFKIVEGTGFVTGISVLIGGVFILTLITIILVREYEFIKS